MRRATNHNTTRQQDVLFWLAAYRQPSLAYQTSQYQPAACHCSSKQRQHSNAHLAIAGLSVLVDASKLKITRSRVTAWMQGLSTAIATVQLLSTVARLSKVANAHVYRGPMTAGLCSVRSNNDRLVCQLSTSSSKQSHTGVTALAHTSAKCLVPVGNIVGYAAVSIVCARTSVQPALSCIGRDLYLSYHL